MKRSGSTAPCFTQYVIELQLGGFVLNALEHLHTAEIDTYPQCRGTLVWQLLNVTLEELQK